MNSVYATFAEAARQHPRDDFLHIPAQACSSYHEGCIDLSYGDAATGVETLRTAYADSGYGQGTRVALMLQNRPDFLLHWFALNGLGASVVPINDEMSPEEQAYIINHSEASLLVHLPELANKLPPLMPLLEQSVALHCADSGEPLPSASKNAINHEPDLQTECALLYTSGSTGKPKGCILTNEYYLLSGQRYVGTGGLCALETGAERLITPLPLVHMNAMACSTLAMIISGGCLVQLDRFHPIRTESRWRHQDDAA